MSKIIRDIHIYDMCIRKSKIEEMEVTNEEEILNSFSPNEILLMYDDKEELLLLLSDYKSNNGGF